MRIVWSDFAVEMLKDVFDYHKKEINIKVASSIKSKIFEAVKKLKDYPMSGQEELSLTELNEGHRYVVSGNYKVIYKIISSEILISDVFDTRQSPVNINNPQRK